MDTIFTNSENSGNSKYVLIFKLTEMKKALLYQILVFAILRKT